MTEPDPRDLWPDAETLAAGDEDKSRECGHGWARWRPDIPCLVCEGISEARDYMNSDWPRARPFQEDGHLAADDHWKEHPNE